MATKKCPKCGEENPAEAVMCWACYTPLAGGAAAATAGGLVAPRGGAAAVTPAATAARDDEEKQKIDPKIFLVVGLLFGAMIIGGFTTGFFSSLGASSEATEITPTEGVPVTQPQAPTNPNPAPGPITVPGSVNVPTTTGGGTVAAIKRYEVFAPPNPGFTVGTIGIYATTPGINEAQAIALAKFARDQFAPTGKWTQMQVVVFNNRDSAKVFQKYQAKRQNAALTLGDFQRMANDGVWSSAPAYVESQANKLSVFRPARSPNRWWELSPTNR